MLLLTANLLELMILKFVTFEQPPVIFFVFFVVVLFARAKLCSCLS